jgi:hypothetical protein
MVLEVISNRTYKVFDARTDEALPEIAGGRYLVPAATYSVLFKSRSWNFNDRLYLLGSGKGTNILINAGEPSLARVVEFYVEGDYQQMAGGVAEYSPRLAVAGGCTYPLSGKADMSLGLNYLFSADQSAEINNIGIEAGFEIALAATLDRSFSVDYFVKTVGYFIPEFDLQTGIRLNLGNVFKAKAGLVCGFDGSPLIGFMLGLEISVPFYQQKQEVIVL